MFRLLAVLIMVLGVSCSRNSDDEARAAAYKAHNEARQDFYEQIEKERREWTVRASIQPGDTTSVLMLKYRDEIGLTEQVAYCMAIFENAKEYKLVAPWIHTDIRIQKSNMLSDKPIVVPKADVNIGSD